MKNHPVSDETRRKLSDAALGRVPSEEQKQKQSAALKGKPKSALTRQRMKEAAARRDPSHNAKIANALRGRQLSAAHIDAQRAAKKASGTWKPIGHSFVRQGYRWIKVAEGMGRDNYRPEHRLVIEQSLGRELCSDEHVHHINGNSLDNRIDNLAVISRRDHTLISKLLRVADEALARTIVRTFMRRFPNLDLQN